MRTTAQFFCSTSEYTPDARDGCCGHTSALNGLCECEACNYAKEAPGWTVTTAESNGEHSAEFLTPTDLVTFDAA